LDRNIYGTANVGPFGAGVIFRLSNAQIAVNEISPTSGIGMAGAALSVLGGGFEPGTTVTIGGKNATNIIVADPTFLYLDMPALSPGTYDVTVTAPGGAASATLGAAFVVQAAGPAITSFTPASGPVGTKVVISGTGFTGVSKVRFNGKDAGSVTVDSSTQITGERQRRHHVGQDHRHHVGGHGHQRERLHRGPPADGDRVQPGQRRAGDLGRPHRNQLRQREPGDLQQHHDERLLRSTRPPRSPSTCLPAPRPARSR
jgi:hypothetical protein